MAALFFKDSKDNVPLTNWEFQLYVMWLPTQNHNPIAFVMSYCLEVSHRAIPYWRQGIKAWTPGVKDHEATLGLVLGTIPHPCSSTWLFLLLSLPPFSTSKLLPRLPQCGVQGKQNFFPLQALLQGQGKAFGGHLSIVSLSNMIWQFNPVQKYVKFPPNIKGPQH